MPPLLGQLAEPPGFVELASQVGRLRARVRPALVTVTAVEGRTLQPVAALRVRDNFALALAPGGRVEDHSGVDVSLASDAASGLAAIQAIGNPPRQALVRWSPQRLDEPRYFAMTVVVGDSVSLSPAFVGGLQARTAPTWPGPIWSVPPGTDIKAGSFLFTLEGELAGLATDEGGLAIVPADTLLDAFDRLLARGDRPRGHVGIEVQALNQALAAATGVRTGVIVTWVDPTGPAARDLAVGDVLESANGAPLETPQHWQAEVARLGPGESTAFLVNRRGERRDVTVVAAPPGGNGAARPLGLVMRTVAGVGAEITRVEPGSAAAAAGLQPGDFITLAGDTANPTPAQVRAAFASALPHRPLLMAITRNTAHLAVSVAR